VTHRRNHSFAVLDHFVPRYAASCPPVDIIPLYPAAEVLPLYPATDVLPLYPAADVLPLYPATEVLPLYPATEVLPLYPATDVLPLYPATDVLPLYPAADSTPSCPAPGILLCHCDLSTLRCGDDWGSISGSCKCQFLPFYASWAVLIRLEPQGNCWHFGHLPGTPKQSLQKSFTGALPAPSSSEKPRKGRLKPSGDQWGMGDRRHRDGSAKNAPDTTWRRQKLSLTKVITIYEQTKTHLA
jgi:hypothetical protein